MTHSSPKIWLISPARQRAAHEDFLFKMAFLNLPYIAAVTPPEFQVEIIDEEHQQIDFDGDPWLVALTAQTPVAPRAYEIADRFRARGILTVMGGPHASILPREAGEHVDAVIVGEGEALWPRVLADALEGRLQPVYQGDRTRSLDRQPMPSRELLNPRFYIPLTMVETTRGCPHRCDFCGVSQFFGHRYRKRPVSEVVDELRGLFGSGFRHRISRFFAGLGLDLPYFIERRLIYFIDSNFAADREYARRLMTAMEKMDVLWWAHMTVDIAGDESLLELMRASGCIAVNIGFESLSPENLKAMHKSFAGSFDYRTAVERLHAHGIGIMGTFVVGFDDEDETVFDRILDFTRDNRLDWALVFIRTPYPGTSLFDTLQREGRILTRDWSRYDTLHCVFAPRRMTPDQLEAGLRRTWKQIFAPGSIYKRILKAPRIHPFFYLSMNLQFYRMVRHWNPAVRNRE